MYKLKKKFSLNKKELFLYKKLCLLIHWYSYLKKKDGNNNKFLKFVQVQSPKKALFNLYGKEKRGQLSKGCHFVRDNIRC